MIKKYEPPETPKLEELDKKQRDERVDKFKKAALDKYGERIKCIVVMGSVARGEFKSKSDIDLFVILDDTEKEVPFDEKSKIDGDLVKTAKDISPNLSVQPLYTLTEFMDYARIGHPIIYNFIKEGKAIYDQGFFVPFQRLLLKGRIPMTREAIESYMEGAPKKLMRAKTVKLLMLAEDCYYAILNSAQAVMMFMGIEPPVPNKAYDEFKKYLVEPGIVEPKYAEILKEIITIRKKIEHKELMEAEGAFVDEWIEKSDAFVNKMYDILSVLEIKKKEKVLYRTHDVMQKAVVSTLKTLNKMPSKEGDMMDVFKKELVDTKMLDGYYLDVWKKLDVMKGLADGKKLDKVAEKDVYVMRENVRNMIRDLSRVLQTKGKK
jgi:predicted nucleotidyltransferase/uncharacterized protein (UPF0332 family)